MADNDKVQKQAVALYVTYEIMDGYFHVYASPAVLHGSVAAHTAKITYPRGEVNGWYLDDLRIYSQGNDDDRERRLYAFRAEFKKFSLELNEAVKCVKTLSRIEKGLNRLTEKRGYAKSFGEYVARVAEVLGAKVVVFPKERRRSYDADDHRYRSLGDARSHIEHLEEQWKLKELAA